MTRTGKGLSTGKVERKARIMQCNGKAILQDIFVMKKEIERIVTCKRRSAPVTLSTSHPKPLKTHTAHPLPQPAASLIEHCGYLSHFHLLKVRSLLVNISTCTRDSPHPTDISEAVSFS